MFFVVVVVLKNSLTVALATHSRDQADLKPRGLGLPLPLERWIKGVCTTPGYRKPFKGAPDTQVWEPALL